MEIRKATFVMIGVVVLAQIPYLLGDFGASVPYPNGYRKWVVTRSFLAGLEGPGEWSQ